MENLSRPQRLILLAILQGYTSQKKLADKLDKNVSYIKYHLAAMYKKAGVDDMTALVIWAYKNGIAQ